MYVQEAFDMKEWLRQNGKIDIWKTEATRIRDILGHRKHMVGKPVPTVLLFTDRSEAKDFLLACESP